jgi:hypothetical protein
MKKHIATIVTLAVLLVLAFLYINKDVGFKSTANAIQIDQLPSICGSGPESDWQKCRDFVDQVLDDSSASTDQEIVALRAQILNLSQQISTLNAN